MSKMRFGVCNGAGNNGDHNKNQAQRLSGLGYVDTAGGLYLRTDTYYSRGNKQQDQDQNQDAHRGDMPKLRKQVEGLSFAAAGRNKYEKN